MSHLNNTPKPDSVQKPGFVIFRGCLLVRQPLRWMPGRGGSLEFGSAFMEESINAFRTVRGFENVLAELEVLIEAFG